MIYCWPLTYFISKNNKKNNKKSSSYNDNNINIMARTLLGKWGLENWTKENVFSKVHIYFYKIK